MLDILTKNGSYFAILFNEAAFSVILRKIGGFCKVLNNRCL